MPHDGSENTTSMDPILTLDSTSTGSTTEHFPCEFFSFNKEGIDVMPARRSNDPASCSVEDVVIKIFRCRIFSEVTVIHNSLILNLVHEVVRIQLVLSFSGARPGSAILSTMLCPSN